MAKAEANVGPTFAKEPKDYWQPRNCQYQGETEEELAQRKEKSMEEIEQVRLLIDYSSAV
jgi:hypothetical protein